MQSNIRVFFTNTETLSDERQQRLFDVLPAAQKTKALGIQSKKKRRDYIVGRTLLIHALLNKYSLPILPAILERPDEAPAINDSNEIYLSISHSDHMVCCVLHEYPIGIDMEYKKDRQDLVEKSGFFMNEEEVAVLKKTPKEDDKKDYFYRVWCVKEAAFKALDRLTQQMTTLMSIQLTTFFREGEWSRFEREIGNYHLSLVYRGGEHPVQCVAVELDCCLTQDEDQK